MIEYDFFLVFNLILGFYVIYEWYYFFYLYNLV